MPDLLTHVWFSEKVAESLREEIGEKLRSPIFAHGAAGPDVWFSCGFYGTKDKAIAPRGGYMHENRSGEFLTALLEQTKTAENRDGMFAYLAGYLCHYALDQIAHPYIITHTGNYDGTEETRRYRGSHMRLERAIDCYIIRRKYHSTPSRFHLAGHAVPLRRFPRDMKADLDAVYARVFGWEDTWAALNRALRDQRLLYTLVNDPTGLLGRATRLFDNGVSTYDYTLMSYHGRDLDGEKIDYLNLRHTPWHHYADPAIESRESFPELVEKARVLVSEWIGMAYNIVYRGKGTAEEFSAAIGSVSYTSDFPCEDERNFRPFRYEPLFS